MTETKQGETPRCPTPDCSYPLVLQDSSKRTWWCPMCRRYFENLNPEGQRGDEAKDHD